MRPRRSRPLLLSPRTWAATLGVLVAALAAPAAASAHAPRPVGARLAAADIMASHALAVAGLALAALLAAGAAVLLITRQRLVADQPEERTRPAQAPPARRGSARLLQLRAPQAEPEPGAGHDARPPVPVEDRDDLERCMITLRRLGRGARFEVVQIDDDGDPVRLGASASFAARRWRAVRPTRAASAMHDALVRYLRRQGWEAEASSGDDWYRTRFHRHPHPGSPVLTVRASWPAGEGTIAGPVAEPAAVVPQGAGSSESGRRALKAFTGLTGVQIFQVAASLITAPLIARALGAEGRGLLAAVAVPLGVAPFLLQFGLGAFAINRTARGVPIRVVFGSLALPTLLLGALAAIAAPFIAGVLSDGREPVDHFLIIGLALMPVALLLNLAMNIAHGLSDWRVLTLVRALPPLVVFVGVVALFAVDDLTVKTAAIVTIVSGLAPILALGGIFRRAWPPRIELRMVREGVSFGARAWVGTLATLANQRLDQLLMIPLVPPRELGLYAVAVTISSLSTLLTGQVVTVLIPRIAEGQIHLAPQAMRCLLMVVTATALVLAAGTLLFLVPVFGADFAAARPLVLVLLVAVIPLAGLGALGQWLPAANRPGAPSMGELVSLAITVPGLILLLPTMGAMGAALVSLVAYSTTFAILLVVMARHLHHRITDYVVPRRADLSVLAGLARAVPLPRRLRGRVSR
jgi:O-antigen/teichoic acid export membrane protein